MASRLPPGRALGLLIAGTGMGWGIMKLATPSESQFYDELAPDLKRKVDERRKQSAEWDKLYGKTTVEEQYQKAVEREEPKKI
ncbi:hypothetical protein PGT21_031893 [Puccinia graminis f. sp. tritici]|uniref:Cytochrome b mRNA-processing protein 4 n=2 Tax=Puccinia graminis f. sp. tritici TaxID=56615 RepID=E3JRH8_PUCGT|nr:uncharacterized protein PGTG_00407 [Puccinia graminis f. sp. tritici CRL 75-36-700-3]EFP74451.1 hypothetical protein PGTG_00407 [Puccinia graminis f. sp. tritici CRL 75-36-700-3]KAA1106158.1 hypothetical protein PGT21_030008 [Puccinia graminis f. sp. tritici]KAA1115120.1 hypothetical protein PGT21_031893 [Puccinia graminis f. sp. tritici]